VNRTYTTLNRTRGRISTATIALAAAAALVPAALAATAAAQPAGDDRRAGHEMRMRSPRAAYAQRGPRARAAWDRLLAAADELGLSDSQQDKLRALRRSAPGVLMPKRQAIAEARLDLEDLMARKDADAAALRQAHERLVQARGALATATFDLRMQAREVLTAQQRNKLREMRRPGALRREMRRGELPPPLDAEAFDAALDTDFDSEAPDAEAEVAPEN